MSKHILLVVPSTILARGLEQIFEDLGEFEVCGTVSDLSGGLKNIDPDVVIVDPSALEPAVRANVKAVLPDTAVLALATLWWDEDTLKQYDGVIGLYDAPTTVIRKVRAALESRTEPGRPDGEELSLREKEILICVAKGMLNMEIADLYNISIYTVITHRKNITRKTGIKTVAGLTVYAILNNLIDMNSVES